MKAVILAAGEGKRYRPLTVSRPQGMVRVAGKPALEHIITALREGGINEIVIVVGYRHERIMSHFRNGKDFGVSIEYAHQKSPLGTGDALRYAKDFVEEDFIMVPSDCIPSVNSIKELMTHKPTCMVITRSRTPSKYGFVTTRGGSVVDISVVRRTHGDVAWIDSGIYLFSKDIFSKVENSYKEGLFSLSHTLKKILSDTGGIPYITSEHWIPATYPWDLLEANARIVEGVVPQKEGTIDKGVVIKGAVSIGKGTRIKANTYIEGPVIIGENCEIGPFATILPSSTIENNVSVGPYTKIRHSVIMEGSRIRSHTSISNSVLASGTSLGSHFIGESGTVQYRFEKFFEGQTSVLLSKQLGVVIGEYTVMGSNVTMLPGKIVGARCIVESGAVIRKDIPDDSRVM